MNTKKSTAKGKLRFEINPVCAECMKCKATCGNGTACQSVRKKLRAYNGVRPTADGFDCALPLSIDSHIACSFGCLYCNIAGTKIWLADGTFKDIEKIIPGDIVIGFEQIANKNRHFAYSKVEEVFSRKAPVIKIKTASGKIITCTKDHPWYTGRIEAKYMYEPAKVGRPLMFVIEPRTKSEITTDYKKGYIRGLIEGDGTIVDKVYTNAKRSRHIKNVRIAMKDEPPLNRFVDFVKDLKLKAYKGIFTYKGGKLPCVRLYGDDALNLAYKNNPLNNDEYWRGWLAGIFDAEGSTHKVLRIAQYPHIHPKIYNSIKKGLSRFSFKFVEEKSAVRMKGGRHEVMRFWALTQPTLWRKVEKVIIGQRLLPQKDQIVSITELGEAQVYSLKTSTHNYIANGYVSRNCFTPNLIQGREKTLKPVGQTSLNFIEGIFSGRKGKTYERFRKILKYDQRNANGYPCPVQCGALADPFDNIERNQGWTLKFIELCKKYNQPCRFSTKGNLFLVDEYINAMKEKPHLFWVAFSIISADDEIIKQLDIRHPPIS